MIWKRARSAGLTDDHVAASPSRAPTLMTRHGIAQILRNPKSQITRTPPNPPFPAKPITSGPPLTRPAQGLRRFVTAHESASIIRSDLRRSGATAGRDSLT